MLYEQMLTESQRLEKEILSLKKQLKAYPKGKFFCIRNGNRYKWYQSDGKKQIYIPKSNRTLAEQLAAKKYLSLRLDDLTREKRAIDFYLRHHSKTPEKAEQLLTNEPEYQRLLSSFFKPQSQELSERMNSPYKQNAIRLPGKLIITNILDAWMILFTLKRCIQSYNYTILMVLYLLFN